MRPPDSIPVKVPIMVYLEFRSTLYHYKWWRICYQDYAIETPLKISSKEKEVENLQTVKIGFDSKSLIAAINFVLKV